MAGAAMEDDCCWICLSGSEVGPLCSPCRCPRAVHAACTASWQLHRAGTSEEKACRFCGQNLPEWLSVLAPHAGGAGACVVAVIIDGVEMHMRVQPTEQGIADFQRRIEAITGAPLAEHAVVNFFCRHPLRGDSLQLSGAESLAAAIHCAAVTAAQRAYVEHPRELAPMALQQGGGAIDGGGSSSSSASDGGDSSGGGGSSSSGSDGGGNGSSGSQGWRVQRRLAKAASALLLHAAKCCRVPSAFCR